MMGDTPVIVQKEGRRPRLHHALPKDPSRRFTVLGVHGSGAVAGIFVTDAAGYQAVIDRAGAAVTPDWFGDNVRGSLCAYLWDDQSSEVLVLPDPFAAGLVYLHRDRTGTTVSSCLAGLVGTLAGLGRKPAKSLGFLTEFIATTTGGWAHPASYAGIEVLAPFEYLRISARDGVRRCTYRAAARLLDRSVPYQERLAAAADEIRSNVAALATSRRNPKVLHLTGGFDTRLVLAAVLEAGYADRFLFTCTGRAGTEDKRVSAALAAEFGLTMTDGPGAPLAEHPRTLIDQVLWQMRAAYGMATVGPHRGYRSAGSVVGAGGYGELARSFYSHRARHLAPGDAAAIATEFWGPDVSLAPGALLAPAPIERFLTGLCERLDAAGRLGVRADALWDYLYLTGRNRYFVGEISRQWTPVAARFDPLYSLNAAALSLALPVTERAANLIGFDLMNIFCPVLAELPFDRDRYTDAYVDLRGEPKRREFTPDRPEPKRVPTFPVPAQPGDRETFPEPNAADHQLAARLRIIPEQAASIGVLRADVRRLAAEIGPAALGEIVNRPVFDKFLRNPISSRGRFRALSGLRTALLWYADADGVPARPWWRSRHGVASVFRRG